MQLPLQITCRDVELTPAEEASIRESAAKLESFWDRITSCRVVVNMPRRRGHTGQHYNVRIDVKVPGAELVIKRQAPRPAGSWRATSSAGTVVARRLGGRRLKECRCAV